MNFNIEPANSSDVDALFEIEHAVFVKSDGIITRRTFLNHIKSRSILLVAKHGCEENKVVGYILVYVHKVSARIYSLAVHPDFQCHGAAKTLLKHALDMLETSNISTVKLEFRKSNTRVKRLYESFGFKQKMIIEDYYGDHETAISMNLAIKRLKCIAAKESLNALIHQHFLTETYIQNIHLPN